MKKFLLEFESYPARLVCTRTILPVKRTPVPAFTAGTYVGRMTLITLDFHRSDKLQAAFFALVKVHHSKERTIPT